MFARAGYLRALCVAVVLSLLSFPSSAQNFRGQVRGLVIDQSGAVVAGAQVTFVNVNTGITVTKTTDNAGLYGFDYVDPGTFRITIESPGFGKYVQENIVIQAGSDVTVNATLNPGTLQQSVTVEATPPAVEFNSSNQELTIDTKMANDTPRLDRNPFKLTLLEPAAVNTRGEMQPYNSWAANSVELGGNTNLANNLLVDGNPIGIGHKAGYPPNQDDVQESVVSQNSVDAASGHSAGGLISLTTKSGTNDWHGSAFYLGRYPWLSAVADRTRFVENAQRQNMYGGTFGNPILKNNSSTFSRLKTGASIHRAAIPKLFPLPSNARAIILKLSPLMEPSARSTTPSAPSSTPPAMSPVRHLPVTKFPRAAWIPLLPPLLAPSRMPLDSASATTIRTIMLRAWSRRPLTTTSLTALTTTSAINGAYLVTLAATTPKTARPTRSPARLTSINPLVVCAELIKS